MKKILVAFSLAAMLTIGSTAAMAATAPAYNSTEMKDNLAPNDTSYDNGLENANKSGIGVGGQTETDVTNLGSGETKTHTAYQKNTNSCAACHQTHTGAAKNLLIKSDVYNTCVACHDGTLGFYNVFTASAAGTFGGTSAGNMSVHMANDTVAIKAAPGGDSDGTGSWGNTFACASCHAPHGSYSDRLLNSNPNNMALVDVKAGGNAVIGSTIYTPAQADALAADANNPYIIVRGTAADFGITIPSTFTGATSASTVIVLYELSGDKYVLSSAPWLYSGEYDSTDTYKIYESNFFNGVTDYSAVQAAVDAAILAKVADIKKDPGYVAAQANIINPDDKTDIKFNYGQGYVIGITAAGNTLLASATNADIARPYIVKLPTADAGLSAGQNAGHTLLTVNDYNLWASKLADGVTANPNYMGKGFGVKVSKYCAACHTDYMNEAGSLTGTFTSAYRHNTVEDNYTCLRCHFAHGTDVNTMKDASGQTAQNLFDAGKFPTLALAQAYMLDKNPSSALKKFTNMSVCWGCHTSSKSTVFINTGYYQDAFNAGTAPAGLPFGN